MINLKNISGSDYEINNLVVDPQVLDTANDGKILAGQVIDISVSLSNDQIKDSDQILKGILNDILVFCNSSNDEYSKDQSLELLYNAPQSFIEGIDFVNNSLVVNAKELYVVGSYTGTKIGTKEKPFSTIEAAILASEPGTTINIKSVTITSAITLPHSLNFFGFENCVIKYNTYDKANGNIFFFDGNGTQNFEFKDIEFKNSGAYGLLIKKTNKVTVRNCDFVNCGWDGQGLNTVLPSSVTGVLGYDSLQSEFANFYYGTGDHASNGGAMRIEECRLPLIRENRVENCLRGIRLQDSGINGGGFVIENQCVNNIESGIYLAAGSAFGGCQNITVAINYSAYNSNNGLLVIGGINNKFSQNEVYGNWSAGLCAWGSTNLTLRDSGLYDNNRSAYNGIGNNGDAKASVQINDAYSFIATQIVYNPDTRFIAEILDTQVHYTGLGSNTEKIGFLLTSGMGLIPDNPKNIIKIDDVGFIGQDYAIDLSEVDITNLRLSLGDNSYQSIAQKAVKAPLAGNYSELPFSNHVMQVPEVDVVVDTLKKKIALHEGVGGNVINTYNVNELSSVLKSNSIDIIISQSDKIQLRDLTFGNIYINGVLAGNNLNSANDSLNAAFNMNLTQYKDFLVSEVGVNGDSSSGGSLPAIANNWYISYGSQAGTQINQSTIGNNFRNYNPFYNGEPLEKGHEFIWTINSSVSYIIGIWGAAQGNYAGSVAIQPSNWSQGFGYNASNNRFSTPDSSGVTIQQGGDFPGMYEMTSGQVALRFGQDNYLYLFEVVGGGYTLIGKSNSTIIGSSVIIQFAGFNEVAFPIMTERTETWEFVADEDSSENNEWSNGLEDNSVIRSRMSISPGEKVTLNLSYNGSNEGIGFGYSGTATGQGAARNLIDSCMIYTTGEALNALNDAEWIYNTNSPYYVSDNGGMYQILSSTPVGLISVKYTDNNIIKLFSELNNELIATLAGPRNGSPINIYIGAAGGGTLNIPTLIKYDMSAEEDGVSVTGWYYIESPDGNFEYPLFKTQEEANYIDSVEGGSGTSSTITYVDDLSNTTWYHPTTSFINNGTNAPQGGVFGNSINVVWNEQQTGSDGSYAPTFTDITYTIEEGSAVNIQYKPQGDTDIYNVTSIPSGYADTGNAIVGSAETITNGINIQHIINVTRANDFGSDTGTITLNVTDDPTNNVIPNTTSWTKALDFSGSNEHLKQVQGGNIYNNPLRMSGLSVTASANSDNTKTSSNSSARPWATTMVFKADRDNSNQHIWNSGEGASSGDDNLYLRLTAAGSLMFGWGREGTGYNECKIANQSISSSNWYGVYIAHKGARFNASDATATNLANAFDIRLMSSNDSFASLGSNLSTVANWAQNGYRMDRYIGGDFTIGGRGGNRNFHGKVASMVIATLKLNDTMATDAEVKLMITDPKKWEDDYRNGNTVRVINGTTVSTYSPFSITLGYGGTQIWLMGDGSLDSYSNGIRNEVYPSEQNYTKMQLNSMTSNDIENINITGLTS